MRDGTLDEQHLGGGVEVAVVAQIFGQVQVGSAHPAEEEDPSRRGLVARVAGARGWGVVVDCWGDGEEVQGEEGGGVGFGWGGHFGQGMGIWEGVGEMWV